KDGKRPRNGPAWVVSRRRPRALNVYMPGRSGDEGERGLGTILQVPRPGPSLLPTRRRRLAAHLPAVNQPQEFLHRPLELLIPAAVHSAGLVAHQDVRLRLPVLEETAGRCILDAPG